MSVGTYGIQELPHLEGAKPWQGQLESLRIFALLG
jgi:hypothetical protein